LVAVRNTMIKTTSKDLATGAGLGVVADLLVELFRIPVLNDSGTFGNTTISNFEIIAYGLSMLGVIAGIIDTIVGKGVVSFTREHIFKFLGFLLGVYVYEHTIADTIGIRKFNPYDFAGQFIPRVLPADTKIPFVNAPPNAASPILGPLIPK
jgi:hypothetical protein